MKAIFETVQTQFMNLETLLTGLDLNKDLSQLDTLIRVNEALSDTYILLNKGFCENLKMCEKCTSNRDKLAELSAMLDQCEENCIVDEKTYLALIDFRDNIPNILAKMESVYIETIHKVK